MTNDNQYDTVAHVDFGGKAAAPVAFAFGEVVHASGVLCIYCGPCPVNPELLSIVLPVNDIGNPQKILNASIAPEKAKQVQA